MSFNLVKDWAEFTKLVCIPFTGIFVVFSIVHHFVTYFLYKFIADIQIVSFIQS